MATKKSKASKKTTTKVVSKSTKPKSAVEAVENKSKVKAESKVEETSETSVKKDTEETKVKVSSETKKKRLFSDFFAKKYEGKESILTIFKDHKLYGGLLGEVIGTMLITLVILSVLPFNGGAFNINNYMFPVIAIYIAVYAFSGAYLNPLVTVGMMATRRISVIRGIIYIIAEFLGAWIGWLIISGFHLAGGETAMDMSKMAAVPENGFWTVSLIEFLGATIIAFIFARALEYKRSVFTYAAVIAGGIAAASLISYVISAAFFEMNNNFILNPAVAFMLQIFPTSGEDFGGIIGGICQAVSIYALIPMIGGTIGFYLSDFTKKLSED